MAYKVVSQKSWTKGIVAVSNRFSLPKGAILQALNMLLNERGALQTCDGTLIQSVIPGGYGPILEQAYYVTEAIAGQKLALAYSGGDTVRLFNWNTNPAVDALGVAQAITPGWRNPQMFQFAGYEIVTLGNDITPMLYNGSTLVPVTTTPTWQASTLYQVGDRIQAGGHTFTVVSAQLQSTSFVTQSPVSGAGFSGASAPDFASAPNLGNTVSDNQIKWMNTALTTDYADQSAPFGCAHAIVYAAALWCWNTGSAYGGIDGPAVIRQSTANNPNSWPSVNSAYVGKDDGTAGTGIATFTIAEAGISPTGSLVLFKNFTTYQITGVFNATNFAITQVKTDMGCIASRTPVFATGHGIVRLGHLGFALFDGVNDTLISEEVRPYIFGRGDITPIDFVNVDNSRACLVANPPMYCCAVPVAGNGGVLTRVFCYDLIMKAWMIVDVAGVQSYRAFNQVRIAGQNVTSYFGDGVPTVGGNYAIRRWQSGDPTFDGVPIPWSATPEEVGDPGSRAYFRRLMVRGHTATPGTLLVAPSLASSLPPATAAAEQPTGPNSSGIVPANVMGTATYEGDQDVALAIDIAETAASVRTKISGTGRFTLEGVDYHVVIKPPRPVLGAPL